MKLELDDAQAELLRGILDHTLRDLRYEIVATDKVAYKRELVEREETIKSLLEPLGGPLPDQA